MSAKRHKTHAKKPEWELRLYVAGQSKKSLEAIAIPKDQSQCQLEPMS